MRVRDAFFFPLWGNVFIYFLEMGWGREKEKTEEGEERRLLVLPCKVSGSHLDGEAGADWVLAATRDFFALF